MCGICGQAFKRKPCNPEIIALMNPTMSHRGPDDSGLWLSDDAAVALAHRRLSVIDLTESGHQPMQYEEGVFTIVFNGEIYNYLDLKNELISRGRIFKSSSDTEVVLASYSEWGVDCLKRFNGMFAFGLYDSVKRTILLARDRAGEKPLFYSDRETGFSFASELKALMADRNVPRKLNPVALDCFLALGYVPGELCILEGIKKLPPAHALVHEVDTGKTRTWRYWSLPQYQEDKEINDRSNDSSLIDQLEFLLGDSVRRQLVADVPVGILLSGGIDSSLVTALAMRGPSKIKTFTVRFPGYGAYDETEHARLVANHFGADHVELEADASSVDLLPLLARQFDEPIIDSSMVPTYLVSKLVRQHCTVALGGDGGDELFGGYMHHSRLFWLQKKFGRIPLHVRSGIAQLAREFLPIGFKGRNWLQALDVDFKKGLPLIASYFDKINRYKLINREVLDWFEVNDAAEKIRNESVGNEYDILQRVTRMDFNNYLPEDILVKVDRSSMVNSLEVRAPWLDYRIIEFAFGKVPSSMKASEKERKILPKKLAKKLMPGNFDMERKQGFSIPLKSWLQTKDWGDFFRDVLLGSSNTIFNRTFVKALLEGQDRGRSNSERLFGLVMFCLWQKEYKVSF